MKKFCPALLVWFLSLAGVNESVRPQVESTAVSQVEAIPSEEDEPTQQATRAESGLYFPDYVDGGGWSVQLALSNVARRVPAAVAVIVYAQDGQPLPELFDSETTFEIPPLGSQVLRSVGTGEIRRGWIEVRSNPPAVSGLLTYRHSGSGVEVGVAPVPLGDRFALFVEESSEIGTGLAIFKPEADTEVEFRLRDEAGTDPFGQDLTLGDFQQQARTLPEWFNPIGEAFPGDFRGLLFLRTGEDASFAPLGLRFGKRKTSLSAVPGIRFLAEGGGGAPNPFQPTTSTAGPLYFPDYVDGGGWSVQLVLGNLDQDRSVPVEVDVYDEQGRPLDDFFDSATRFELPAQGSRVLKSAGGTQSRRGWIKVQADSASVRGLLVYRNGETGIEVGVAPVEPRDEFALFVEESSEIGTGLALFKPQVNSKVEFRIRDEAGNDPLGNVYIPWRNFRQSARTLSEWLDVDGVETGFLKDFRGLLFLRTEDGSEFAPLGLRFGKETSALSAVPGIGIVDGSRIDRGVGSDGGIEIEGGVGIDGGGMAPSPTVTLSVAPSSIDRGQSATLRWSSTNAESVEITPDIGKVSTSGTTKVSPRTTTTYRITVTAADGQTATATVTVTVAITDRAVLEALYEATDGPNWLNNDNWLTDAPMGEWYGVETDASGRVVSLDLGGPWDYDSQQWVRHGLSGRIPPELASLGALRRLDLSTNNISGSIPTELFGLTNLEELSLQDNVLSGPIPPELGGLAKLRRLNIASNLLTGEIPPELGRLAKLEVLVLHSNRLEGKIPPELGNLATLTNLWLALNRLEGTIPPELGKLAKLTRLWLDRNQLEGNIPPELGNLTELTSLRLDENELEGAIPSQLGDLTDLTYLLLSYNNLTGPIPPELGNLATLGTLRLDNNQLTGRIPPWLADLQQLRRLGLGPNQLTGPIPPELGNLTELESLGLGDNLLTGRVPPELGKLVNLTDLTLDGNPLTGSIPQSFLKLDKIMSLGCRRTEGVCLPATVEFREWLQDIETRGRGNFPVDILLCDEVDKRALATLYEVANGPDWTRSDGWTKDEELDRWHGVSTGSDGRISSLDLTGNGLSGRLPEALGQLTSLTELRIGDNTLKGRLPLSLANTPMEVLDYSGTSLCVEDDPDYRTWLNGIAHIAGTDAQCPPLTEREILETVYGSTDGGNWAESAGWLTGAPLEEWRGVDTDDKGRVVALRLANNRLSGTVPVELGQLSALMTLELRNNQLHGRIPLELGVLEDLRVLDLSRNRLGGAIPDKLGELRDLEHVNLSGNQLSGPIPSALGDLPDLQSLFLSDNRLGGRIPEELGNLENLVNLYLDGNRLSGSIPFAIAKGLASLESLNLSNNRLEGEIPKELGERRFLRHLSASDNRLSGRIPPQFGALDRLEHLSLSENELTGPIPPELGATAPDLIHLNLADNQITGLLPPRLGRATQLQVLDLRSNRLSGPIPPEYSRLTRLKSLIVAENPGLSGSLPAGFTALSQLERLLAGNTELCLPLDPRFDAWFGDIPSRRLTACLVGPEVYLTQAVQSWNDPVPLLAGKRALLRVFVTGPRGRIVTMPDVQATFYVNGAERYAVRIDAGNRSLPTNIVEDDLSRSANAEIPGNVIAPGLQMVIEVDPDGILDPALGVTKRIPDSGRLDVDVRTVPRFDLTLVPLLGQGEDSSVVKLIDRIAADPQGHESLHDVRTLLPMGDLDITAHAPVYAESPDPHRLLAQVEAMRLLEGGSGHWMGLFTLQLHTAGNTRRLWPGGVAYTPGRASVSLARPSYMAHELGHNLGLGHAPCGDAPGPDPLFPSATARIGTWGYDFERTNLVPPTAYDLMSYCFDTYWISDYHFNEALNHRMQTAASTGVSSLVAAPAKSLLLWGGVDSEGTPFLEPAFIVEAPASLPRSTGGHQIIGRTTDGDELFLLTFEMPEVADGDGRSSFAFVLPVQPEWADELASITLSGPGGADTLDETTDRPMAILRNPRTGQVRGFVRGAESAPPNVDATVSALSLNPGLERLTSRGIPDPEDWAQ